MHSYWDSFRQRRLSRRRAMFAAGGLAASAAFLAACGGSDDEDDTTVQGDQSGLVTRATDTTAQARQGGVYKASLTQDVGSWDAHTRGAWFGTLGALLWTQLTSIDVGHGQPTAGNVVANAAESWEFAGDGLSVTWKLQPNAAFGNVPPVNGHPVEAEDVIATWNRWREISAVRGTIDNEVNPDAPVQSMTATDRHTVVMKLALPAVTMPSLFSATVGQAFHVFPREAGEGYDPRHTHIGSGPFNLKEHSPSVFVHLERNPGFWHDDRPWFDGIEYPIISEYATGLAAFRSGQIHAFDVRAEEMLSVKRDVQDLVMYQTSLQLPTVQAFFGYKPTQGGMFRDQRLRQAFSMSIDRDLFADVWYDIPALTAEGLPVDTAWSSAVPANEFTGWWLDPQSEGFGPNAKYYQYDIAEAKKLMSAAGFPDGVDFISTRTGDAFGDDYQRQVDIYEGMVAEAGFRADINVVLYQTEMIPNYQSVRGDFEGVGWMLRPPSSSDPIDKLAEYIFSGSGPNFIGFDPDGAGTRDGDSHLDDMIRKSRVEMDNDKRIEMLHDMQRYMAEKMYLIRPVSGATNFSLAWPAVKNIWYFLGTRRSEELTYFWLDESEPPFRSS